MIFVLKGGSVFGVVPLQPEFVQGLSVNGEIDGAGPIDLLFEIISIYQQLV